MLENQDQTVENSPVVTDWNCGWNNEVADKLAATSPVVRQLVVKELADQEIVRRKNAVISLINKFDEKTKELKKAENSGTYAFNSYGDKVGEATFNKEQVESIKKIRQELENISNALTVFFDKNDTKKLYELSK